MIDVSIAVRKTYSAIQSGDYQGAVGADMRYIMCHTAVKTFFGDKASRWCWAVMRVTTAPRKGSVAFSLKRSYLGRQAGQLCAGIHNKKLRSLYGHRVSCPGQELYRIYSGFEAFLLGAGAVERQRLYITFKKEDT